jgi:thiaminase
MASPSTTSREGKLTAYLLALDPESFRTATQARFLEKAGQGTLSREMLQQWLSQDRLYAQAYVRFAALLLANICLPAAVEPDDVQEQLADLIIDSLVNIRRELKFFEGVAQKYGLDVNAKAEEVSDGVNEYRQLFFSTGQGIEAGRLSLLDGMMLLWATEKVSPVFLLCYLISYPFIL